MRSVFNIILFLGLIHFTYGQRTNDIIYDSVIIPQFHDLKSNPVKANYTLIHSKIISKTFPKKNDAELTLKRTKAQLNIHKVLLKDQESPEEFVLAYSSIPIGETDIMKSPPLVFKDNSSLNIKYLDKAHGLFSNTINSIQQDEYGFIWLASGKDGLCSLDGHKMEVFTEKSGLPSSQINYIFYDSQKRLWVGTQKGLCYIKNQKIYIPEDSLIKSMPVNYITEDKNQEIWIGTTFNGIFHFKDDKALNYNRKQGLPGNNVRSILMDKHHHIWIGFMNKGFSKFDGKTFTNYQTPLDRIEKGCHSIYESEAGVWFGFFKEPILFYNGKDFMQYQFGDFFHPSIYSIVENQEGLWFVNYGKGLIRFSKGKASLFNEKTGISSRSVFTGMVDRNQNIWVGDLFSGISRFDGNRFSAVNANSNIPINHTEEILTDKYNRIWYMPNGGKITIEDSSSYTTIMDQPSNEFPPIGHVFDAEFLDNGEIFLATYSKGIIKTDLKSCDYYYFDKGKYILDIAKQSENILWFATESNGLIKYDHGEFYSITSDQDLVTNQLNKVYYDNSNSLWVASSQYGLSIIENDQIAHLSTKDGLSSNTVNCFFEDKKNRVWIGTENGIDIITPNATYRINKNTGLISNKIRSITQDANGFYWIATANGLSRFLWEDSILINLENFNKNDGLNITDFNTSVLSLPDGRVKWGTHSNIVSYHPDVEPSIKHPICIKFDKAIITDTVTTNYRIKNGRLRIPQDGHFEVSFTAIDWGSESEITYQYSILLQDEDTIWNDLGFNNSLLLTDLPHGKYLFLAKAISPNGESEIISLDFYIIPYWWQSDLVVAIFIIFFLSLGPVIFYNYSKRAKRIQHNLETTVQEKTKELVKENKIKDALVQEIHHRVKNNLQSISSLVDMQIRSLKSENEIKALTDTQLRIGAMALVHEMLYTSQDITLVSVKKYIDELVASINEMVNTEKLPIQFEINTYDHMLSVSDCISFGILTSEVISNSIKYAFKGIENPRINIDLKLEKELIIYQIKDNGVGIKEEKTDDTSSLGLRLVDVFSRQLNAKLNIESDKGVVVKLEIPR